jgi:cytochrome c553
MRAPLACLAASLTAGSLALACSGGADSSVLPASHHRADPGNGAAASSGPSGQTTPSSSGGSPSAGPGGTALPPPPDAGPGSLGSAAHQFFDATVYPELSSTCGGCHASGANGAPSMLTSPADTAYSQLDALGLVQQNSALLTKGAHDNGAAPALTPQEQSDVAQWLGMESQEAGGSGGGGSVLSQVAQCVSQSDWNAIGWGNLRTQPRPNENPNKCSGCAYATCASCHAGGEQGFFMDMGTAFDPDGSIAFQQTFQGPSSASFVIQYFGLNGTTPVASNAILNKQQAVATGPAYSHPMFVMPAAMQSALSTFVNDAITSYTSHACKPDGGP